MKFAKLFDLEDGEQVLLTVEYDDDKDQYELIFKTDFNGATASMKLGYKEESMSWIRRCVCSCEYRFGADY